MTTKLRSAIFAVAWASLSSVSLLPAQTKPPVISANTVVNAASQIPPGLPNYGIAQGSIFTLVVQGLASATPAISVASFPLQLTLAGASMQIAVAGATVNVPMIYTWSGFSQNGSGRYDQLAGIVPSTTPVGTGTITVIFNGQTSAPAPITIVPSAFGIFTLNHGGLGPGVFTGPNVAFSSMTDAAHLIGPFFPDSTFGENTLVAAAHPGDQLVIWGTGLGPISGDDTAQPPAGNLNVPVEVYVGKVKADVASQGRASCCSGVDQVQFTVPPGVQGCYVPVAVKIGAVVSNFATVSISPDNSVCSDPVGWSVSDLQSLPKGAPMNIAEFSLTQLTGNFSVPGVGTAQGTIDFASGGFRRYTPPPLGVLASTAGLGSGFPIPSSGCLVFPFGSNGPLFDNFLPNPGNDIPFALDAPYQLLDAGPALNVTGPAGALQIPKNPNLGLNNTEYKVPGSAIGGGLPPLVPLTPEYLTPGSYTVDNGAGGTAVKGFSATITIPSDHASWTGQDAIRNIDRSQDLTITWSGSGLVAISGNSANPAAGFGAQFVCIAGDADNGTFAVPAWVMSALPASGLATDIPAPVAFLGVATTAPAAHTRLQAPGIDAGYFDWLTVQLKNVNFQ